MDEDKNSEQAKAVRTYSPLLIVVTVLIGAWLIGMSILGAGYLISKEIAKNRIASNATQNPSVKADIEVPAGIPVLGDNNASVTIVEFADFQCPFCGEWQKTIYPQIKKDFIDTGKARFVFMNFPFLGDESNRAAEAAKCATDQNKFWEYHDKLYASQNGENEGAFADVKLKAFAKDLNLNIEEFNSCFDSGKYKQEVADSFGKGSVYGVTSTPTVFINGYKSEGVAPFENYKQIIESELSKK